jgi:hypothetical protein
MKSKHYVYSSVKRNNSLYVSANQMLLLKMIGSFGFVTTKQLDLLWSVIQQYPTSFSHSTLSKWTAYDGLLNFVPIFANLNINRSKRTTTAANHNCYVLSKSCAKWLDSLDVLPMSWDTTSINSHNEQATETIVQSLYTAMFGYKSLNYCLPYYCFKDHTYSYCSQAIKGCIQKGEIKGASPIKEDAKTINVTLVPSFKKVNQEKAASLLNALSKAMKEKDLDSIHDYLPYMTNLLATLTTDGIDITPLLDTYCTTVTINKQGTIYKYGKDANSNSSKAKTTNASTNSSYLTNSLDKNLSTINTNAPKNINTPKSLVTIPTNTIKRPAFRKNFHFWLFSPIFRNFWHTFSLAPSLHRDASVSLGNSYVHLLYGESAETARRVNGESTESQRRVSGDCTETIRSVSGELTEGKRRVGLNKLYPSCLLFFRDAWCQLSLNSINELGNYLGNYWRLQENLLYSRRTVNDIFAFLPNKKESKLNTVHQSNQKYVAISHPPNKRRHQNHVISIDSKKFKKFSKQSNTHYSDNLLNQQDELLGLLNNNEPKKVQNKKAATSKVPTYKNHEHKKHKGASIKNKQAINAKKKVNTLNKEKMVPQQNGVNLQTVFSYYYPNQSYLIKVQSNISIHKTISSFNELPIREQLFLVNLAIANIYIYQHYLTTTYTAEYSKSGHLSIPFKRRYDFKETNIQRGTDLIANPSFDLCNYDFRSFNQQFGFKTFAESKNLPFVSDEMISFRRNNRRHEVFLELDNRTEANNTQIQKIMNYIWYALENPEKDIEMIIAITDGSLKSKRVPDYTNIGRKLGNLATQFIRTYLDTKSQKRVYLANLYKRATNLHIYLTGVSEAHIDIAAILLGTNSVSDKIETAINFATILSHKTRWSVQFIPSNSIEKLLDNPGLLFASGNYTNAPIKNNKAKSIFRYISDIADDGSTLGMLKFTDKLTGKHTIQGIINGNEHDVDTIVTMYNMINFNSASAIQNQKLNAPICVFPHRIEALTAISLPSYAKTMKYTQSGYSPALSYFIQPRYDDNLPAHELDRWLTVQYAKEIQNYYLIGAINEATLKKAPNYGDQYFALLTKYGSSREYKTLKNLASKLSADKFASQLRLDEIPIGLYKALAERWPSQAYFIPRFMTLPYIKNPHDKDYFMIKDHYDFKEFIHGLDSTLPDRRSSNLL